jgi:REP element-mobilizing transposase RayT
MPDHVHLLVQLDSESLNAFVRRLKAGSARLLNQHIGSSGRFWQAGFHDHALRREESIIGAARYVVANSLRAGLVERMGEYSFWDAVWLDV